MGQVFDLVNAAVAAGASAKVGDVGVVPGYEDTDNFVARTTFVPDTTQAAQGATNFVTLQWRYIRAGGAAVVFATYSLGANGLTANVPAHGVPVAGINLQPDDEIDLYGLQAGTGGAIPAGKSFVELN